MVHYSYTSRTLAALDTDTLSNNIPNISLQQVHNRVRSIGDRINSPPGPRRIPGVKKALTDFEHTGILIRTSGNNFRLTPHLQSVIGEARLRHKIPINAGPRRQMQLYRKVLTELSERDDVDLQGLTPENISALSRNKMQSLLKQAAQQLKLAKALPSSSASALDRSPPFAFETDIGTVFGTPTDGFASDDHIDQFGDHMDMDLDLSTESESQPAPLLVAKQSSYKLQLPHSPHPQPDASDAVTASVGRHDSNLTPTKPAGRHPTGLLTPPDTLHVDRTAYNHLTEELRTKETNLEQAQQYLANERENARVRLREQDEMHMRALEDKDAEIKATEERIVNLEERLASLHEKFDEMRCQKQLLDDQNTHDRARILELEEQISALRAEYNEIFTNLTTANNTISALHEELDAQRVTVVKLRATIDELTHQYEVLEDKNKTQSEVIARRKKHSLDLVHALAQSLADDDLPFELTK